MRVVAEVTTRATRIYPLQFRRFSGRLEHVHIHWSRPIGCADTGPSTAIENIHPQNSAVLEIVGGFDEELSDGNDGSTLNVFSVEQKAVHFAEDGWDACRAI